MSSSTEDHDAHVRQYRLDEQRKAEQTARCRKWAEDTLPTDSPIPDYGNLKPEIRLDAGQIFKQVVKDVVCETEWGRNRYGQ